MTDDPKVAAKVYYCKNGHEPVAIVAPGPVACKECDTNMTEIGWFESE